MNKHCGDFILTCVCMDDESFVAANNLNSNNLKPVKWSVYENIDEKLRKAKLDRSFIEYLFTCSSSICFYIIKNIPKNEILTYIDCDLFFYKSPEVLFQEFGNHSIGIIEHKYFGYGKRFYKYGIFNVGWINFRNDDQGNECILQWRNDCLKWCFDRFENGKFADQKYLDYWPQKYTNLKIIKNIGANVGPWNVGRYKISNNVGELFVDSKPLIFFHFASFRPNKKGQYVSGCGYYLTKLKGLLRSDIYQPYLNIITTHQNFTLPNNKIIIKRGDSHKVFGIKNVLKKFREIFFNDLLLPNE